MNRWSALTFALRGFEHHRVWPCPLERAFDVRHQDFLHRHAVLGEEATRRLGLRLSLAGRRNTHRRLCPEPLKEARGAAVQTLVAQVRPGHLSRRPVRLLNFCAPLHDRISHYAILPHAFSCWRTSHQTHAVLSTSHGALAPHQLVHKVMCNGMP